MKSTAIAALLLVAAPAAALSPSSFVFFGDSFIDAGAVHQFTGGAVAPAAQGFFQGRFSDGPTWADLLGKASFGGFVPTFYTGNPPLTVPGSPGFTFTPGATNFAVGGARAGSDDGQIPGLLTQVGLYNLYRAATGDQPDADTLFVINFGNNDVNYIDGLGTLAEKQAAAGQYVTNITTVVAGLSNQGITNILVAGVPNPTNPTGVALQEVLDMSLDGLAPLLTANSTTLHRFDYFDFFTELGRNPVRFDLPATLITDPTRWCIKELPFGSDCSNYLSFDGIHVTKGVQLAIADSISRQLSLPAVPEASTWGMMIIGFGAVGFAMRRRAALAA